MHHSLVVDLIVMLALVFESCLQMWAHDGRQRDEHFQELIFSSIFFFSDCARLDFISDASNHLMMPADATMELGMDPNSLGDLNVMVDVAVERVLLLHSLPELMLQLHQARCEVAALQEVQDIDTREIRRLLAVIGESHYAGAAAVTAPSHLTMPRLPSRRSLSRKQEYRTAAPAGSWLHPATAAQGSQYRRTSCCCCPCLTGAAIQDAAAGADCLPAEAAA
jgi:hypothetical protein